MTCLHLNAPLVLLLTGWLSGAFAAELPPLTLPAGVGVNIHFDRGHTADLDRIAAAGFKFVRMDLGWEAIERTRGEYDWSASDELLGNLDRRGLRAILILDYSNPLHEATVTTRNAVFGGEQRDTASPQHPESIAAFARWKTSMSCLVRASCRSVSRTTRRFVGESEAKRPRPVNFPELTRQAIRSTIPEPQKPAGSASSIVWNWKLFSRPVGFVSRTRKMAPGSAGAPQLMPHPSKAGPPAAEVIHSTFPSQSAISELVPKSISRVPGPFSTSPVSMQPASRSEPTKPARGGGTSTTDSG